MGSTRVTRRAGHQAASVATISRMSGTPAKTAGGASEPGAAPFASGSSSYSALIICPCSMGTLGRIAAGISNDLITRAADVMLKERRKLILLTRDTPLNYVHIKNMETVTLAGGIICPASPSFYSRPKNFEELARTVTNRAVSLAGLEIKSFKWNEKD